MAASPLSFAGEFRLFFNPRSGKKLQDDVQAQFVAIERIANRVRNRESSKVVEAHRRTVKQIEEVNRQSQKTLDSQSEIISKRIQARSKEMMLARYPKAAPPPTGMTDYANAYTAAVARMKAANKLYIAEAKRMGVSAAMGPSGRFDAGAYATNVDTKRSQGITILNDLIKKNGHLETELKYLRNDAIGTHKLLTDEEKRHQVVVRNGMALSRQSAQVQKTNLREIEFAVRRLNEALRQKALLIAQLGTEMVGNFRSAIMMSGVALMMLGFRLGSVVSTYQEFEKELVNAQSIFQTQLTTLYKLSDQIVTFGQEFGISMGKAAEGLYQLASAGLTAEESIMVLTNTLKLSMAVQGDHNTIAKLTTQVIFGFGLQMSDSAILTDKFAHAINKSLIEYQDLASAVKFAMPFFITTGQNIDQLLGSLEILTNRALEAGIAGRGLRQALAEFAQHADDNTAAFRKLGVEITDTEGNFLMLTEIAKNFQVAMGEMSNDTELLTTLLEDLNVRGATAFVHLVQNADEFQEAVDDLANSAGAATEMAAIQQASLENQYIRLKNILAAPFIMSDDIGLATGSLNEFGETVHAVLQAFEAFVEDEEFAMYIRDFIIVVIEEFYGLLKLTTEALMSASDEGGNFAGILGAITAPLKALLRIVKFFGEGVFEAYVGLKLTNAILPANIALTWQQINALESETTARSVNNKLVINKATGLFKLIEAEEMNVVSMQKQTRALGVMVSAQMASQILMFGMILATQKYAKDSVIGAAVIGAFAGAFIGLAFAINMTAAAIMELGFKGAGMGVFIRNAMITGALMGAAYNVAMQQLFKPTQADMPQFDPNPAMETYTSGMDLGGRIMYDTGGPRGGGLGSRHRSVMVEPGETIIPKTQNMIGGGSGITLNIYGDVYDSDNFAEKISEVLPMALRQTNDIGGI